METSQKGFIVPLLLALIALLLIGGGVYVYVQNKQTNKSAIVSTITQATSTNTTKIFGSKKVLPKYLFEDFPFLISGERQINLEGIFAPTIINLGEYSFSESSVIIRCWEKDMACVFSGIRDPNEYTNYSRPWGALLKITQWDDKQLILSGGVGFYPGCQRDACGQDVEIIVDISSKVARLTHRRCFYECAEDKYILVGIGNGNLQAEDDIPKPEVNIEPII